MLVSSTGQTYSGINVLLLWEVLVRPAQTFASAAQHASKVVKAVQTAPPVVDSFRTA